MASSTRNSSRTAKRRAAAVESDGRAGKDPADPQQLRIQRYHAAFPEANEAAIAAHLAIVGTGAALVQQVSKHLTAGFDVNPARYSLLRALYFCPEGRLPQNEVAREMGTSQPNVTQLLDALERDGLVERVTSDVDRRVTYARLTPAGQEKCDQMVPDMVRFMEGSVAAFTKQEMVTVRRLMAKLRDHLDRLAANEE